MRKHAVVHLSIDNVQGILGWHTRADRKVQSCGVCSQATRLLQCVCNDLRSSSEESGDESLSCNGARGGDTAWVGPIDDRLLKRAKSSENTCGVSLCGLRSVPGGGCLSGGAIMSAISNLLFSETKSVPNTAHTDELLTKSKSLSQADSQHQACRP